MCVCIYTYVHGYQVTRSINLAARQAEALLRSDVKVINPTEIANSI